MSNFLNWINSQFNIPQDITIRLLLTLSVLAVVWTFRELILFIKLRRVTDVKIQYRWRRGTSYVSFLSTIILIGIIWLETAGQIATYLGLLSAGLAISLKDPLTNFIGWGYIIWRRPFKVGDRIQVGTHAGDVIDINIFQFALLEIGNWVDADQSTGRIIHVPNGKIFVEPLANYTEEFDFIWNEIGVTITFESDWQEAKAMLLEISQTYTASENEIQSELSTPKKSKYLYFYTHLTPVVYTTIMEDGVNLTIRYMCRPRNRRSSEQSIIEDILIAFNSNQTINFAYPTRRNIVGRQHNFNPEE